MSAWDDPILTGSLGDTLAGELRQMVLDYENSRARTRQTDIGPSQIGSPCTRCLARHALGVPVARGHTDPWCAIIGTAVHNWLEEAAVYNATHHDRLRYLPEMRVHPDDRAMPNGGSLDLYDIHTSTVIDHKIVSADRQRAYKLGGPGLTYRRQAHIYGLGLAISGRLVDNVAIAFWVRGGRLGDLWVWTETYDPRIAREAIDRYLLIREQALALGVAILPHLPADPDCWDCGGADDVSAAELAQLEVSA